MVPLCRRAFLFAATDSGIGADEEARFGKALTLILGILIFGIAMRSYVFTHQLAQGLASDDRENFITLYIEKIYYPTYTRLDGLLMGVVLAVIKAFRPMWWQKLMTYGYAMLAAGLPVVQPQYGSSVIAFRRRLQYLAFLCCHLDLL